MHLGGPFSRVDSPPNGRRLARFWCVGCGSICYRSLMKYRLPIARGRVSHTLGEDLRWLLSAGLGRLKDDAIVRRAEAAFASHVGRQECVVFPFARTAIHATLQTLELEPGDRVLLPPVTIKGILDVVLDLQLEPIFVDINPKTACFDESALRCALQEGPRVAILTYLFGLVPNVDALVNQLRAANVFIIEDFSQCLNGSWNDRRIGTFGDVSVYSASSIKTFDTFGGGYLVVDDPDRAEMLRKAQQGLAPASRVDLLQKVLSSLVRNLATQRIVFTLLTWPALRLMRRAGQSGITRFTGARDEQPLASLPPALFRAYSAIQARVALEQLPKTVEKDGLRIARINRIDSSHNYEDRPSGHPGGSHVHWQHLVYADNVPEFMSLLGDVGVDCATTSLVLISSLPSYPYQTETPNGARLYGSGVYLPCYHQLRESEADRVAAALSSLKP
jgi:perosamine synthetase